MDKPHLEPKTREGKNEMTLLKIKEAAELWRVHPATVYRWIADGRIPVVRLGPKTIRINADRPFPQESRPADPQGVQREAQKLVDQALARVDNAVGNKPGRRTEGGHRV